MHRSALNPHWNPPALPHFTPEWFFIKWAGGIFYFLERKKTSITSQSKCGKLASYEGHRSKRKVFSYLALFFFPSHESALLITTLAFLSYFYVYSCSYITRELLFAHYSNTAFKVEVDWSGWRGGLVGWQKYLWLFIPSSSFSIRLRITDVGTGIFSSSRLSSLRFPPSFFPSFSASTYIPPVLFDVTATCCSHFLCSVCFSPQLKNAIINNYTEAFLDAWSVCICFHI